MSIPDLVIIGHVAQDRHAHGLTLGGTAIYAALTALRLGFSVGVVTACRPDLTFDDELRQVQWVSLPSPATTSFENIYHQGRRSQRLLARADLITVGAVPAAWRRAPLVLLAPIAQEVPVEMVDLFPETCLAVTAQGWLRGWDYTGTVYYQPWRPSPNFLAALKVMFISEEDVGRDVDAIPFYARQVPLLLETKGERGADLYRNGNATQVQPFKVTAVDPTGAGDVFAASFLLRWYETGDPVAAAEMANCAAALSVQEEGVSAIPTAAQVAAKMRETKQEDRL